jgi:hypothetical protein
MADPLPSAGPGGPQSTAPPPGSTSEEQARLEQAKRQVAAMKGFYIHLAVFVLVLAGLFAINALSRGSWWVQWVFLGWGIGVVAHALAVFGRAPRAVADWEERKAKQLASER